MNTAQLHAELTADPLALGYAAQLNISDNAIAAMLNATTGAGAAVISLTTQSKANILTGLIPALDQLATGVGYAGTVITPAIDRKWTQRFTALRAGNDQIDLTPQFMGMLGQLVSDGIIPQPYIDAFTVRVGSRAEVLWGAGTQVSPVDVQTAMGR
jgi:hypothetical protein